jgi:hypothetical protein
LDHIWADRVPLPSCPRVPGERQPSTCKPWCSACAACPVNKCRLAFKVPAHQLRQGRGHVFLAHVQAKSLVICNHISPACLCLPCMSHACPCCARVVKRHTKAAACGGVAVPWVERLQTVVAVQSLLLPAPLCNFLSPIDMHVAGCWPEEGVRLCHISVVQCLLT